MRSPRVCCDVVARGHWLSQPRSLVMHEYPLFWMCLQPAEPVQGRYAIGPAAHGVLTSCPSLLFLKDEVGGAKRPGQTVWEEHS